MTEPTTYCTSCNLGWKTINLEYFISNAVFKLEMWKMLHSATARN